MVLLQRKDYAKLVEDVHHFKKNLNKIIKNPHIYDSEYHADVKYGCENGIKEIKPFASYFEEIMRYLDEQQDILRRIVRIAHNKEDIKDAELLDHMFHEINSLCVRISSNLNRLKEFYIPETNQVESFSKWVPLLDQLEIDLQHFENTSIKFSKMVLKEKEKLQDELKFLHILDEQEDKFINNVLSWLHHTRSLS